VARGHDAEAGAVGAGLGCHAGQDLLLRLLRRGKRGGNTCDALGEMESQVNAPPSSSFSNKEAEDDGTWGTQKKHEVTPPRPPPRASPCAEI